MVQEIKLDAVVRVQTAESSTRAVPPARVSAFSDAGVTDPFNSADAQTCSYSHDDLSRIASANCGSVWSQTFGFDAFGNISKSGSSSFQPTYSTSTNRMTLIGSSTPSYDSNGNVTNDFLHTYGWDANGRPVTIDAVNVTYDALGRMVEQNRSGAYTEIVYTPSGAKLALMNGSTLQKGFVPLTGGSMAVYNSNGLAYYRHSDWVGSSRFASTPSRTMYSDGAYAPFGEPYAQAGTTDLSFTGMNQDTVSNLYDFPSREYGIQGRWPSPDPAGVSSVDPSDPRTWNRYAYVRNNPLALTDPTGEADYCFAAEEATECANVSYSVGAYVGLGPSSSGVIFGNNEFDALAASAQPPPDPSQYQPQGNFFVGANGWGWSPDSPTAFHGTWTDPSNGEKYTGTFNTWEEYTDWAQPKNIYTTQYNKYQNDTLQWQRDNLIAGPGPGGELPPIPPKPPLSQRLATYLGEYVPCALAGTIDKFFGDPDRAMVTLVTNLGPVTKLLPFGALGTVIGLVSAGVWDIGNAREINMTCTVQVYGARK